MPESFVRRFPSKLRQMRRKPGSRGQTGLSILLPFVRRPRRPIAGRRRAGQSALVDPALGGFDLAGLDAREGFAQLRADLSHLIQEEMIR